MNQNEEQPVSPEEDSFLQPETPSSKPPVTNRRRLAVISVITVLSVLLIAATGLAAYLYCQLYRSGESGLLSQRQEQNETLPTRLLYEIGALYEKYYVNDIDTEAMEEALLQAFFTSVNDRYGAYYTPEQYLQLSNTLKGSNVGIGVLVSKCEQGVLVERVFPDSPAAQADIRVDDVIIGTPDMEFAPLSMDDALSQVRGEAGTQVTLRLQRGEEVMTLTVTRASYTATTVESRMLEQAGKRIGYILIDSFYANTEVECKAALEALIDDGAQGIVFDLRNNPGGLLDSVVALLDDLLPEGPIVHVRYKQKDATVTHASSASYLTDLPFAVVVNGETASAAELFTSTLKDYQRAVVVGDKTYGKGCGQVTYRLPSGGNVKLTAFYYDPPYSENYNGVGIVPDVSVSLDDQWKKVSFRRIPAGEDAQLQAALDALVK